MGILNAVAFASLLPITGSFPLGIGDVDLLPSGPSSDDCAVVVEIGRARMHWGTARQYEFVPAQGVFREGEYLKNCPWKALGVSNQEVGNWKQDLTFSISRPTYDGVMASVLVYMRTLQAGHWGFAEDDTCVLRKVGSAWRLVSCEVTGIS